MTRALTATGRRSDERGRAPRHRGGPRADQRDLQPLRGALARHLRDRARDDGRASRVGHPLRGHGPLPAARRRRRPGARVRDEQPLPPAGGLRDVGRGQRLHRPRRDGRGLGALLYGALLPALEDEDLHRAYGGVALPNPASVALHERFGFREAARYSEQGRKFGRYWDVVWLERPLGEPVTRRRRPPSPRRSGGAGSASR